MTLSRRDGGAVSGPTGLSLAMLVLGIASLAVAASLCLAFALQLRRSKARRLRLAETEKRSKIGHPVLQKAPQHVMDSSLSLAQLTGNMRQLHAQRQFRPLAPSQAYMNTVMAQSNSSASSGSKSSGPLPPSSSEETGTSHVKANDKFPSVQHASTDARPSIQRPGFAVTEATPSFARQKRISRVAVPSALLRGLGDLPQLPVLSKSNSHLSPKPDGATAEDDEGSYTPVLGLDLELNAKSMSSNNLEDDLEFEIERSRWLTSTLTSAFECTTPKKATFDLESQRAQPQPQEKRMTGGPSRVTVDYFSLTGRRSFAPSTADSSRPVKPTQTHRARANSTSSSPHKRPDLVLPPIPTAMAMAKQAGGTSSQEATPSTFRPLSLGLSLHSSSKASSLDAAAMFGDVPATFWSEGAEHSTASSSSNTGPLRGRGSSEETHQRTDLSFASRSGASSSGAATSLEITSFDAQSAAFLRSKEQQQLEQIRTVPTIVHSPPPLVPFMTPHHRAVFPDQLSGDDDVRRDSRRLTPDLSMIHEAPLPPPDLPFAAKAGFASSLRARAKLTLSRSRTSSTATPPVSAPRGGERAAIVRPDSFASSRSPADTLGSYGPPVETWKVSCEDRAPPFLSPPTSPTLGLGLKDENGMGIEERLTSSSVGHGGGQSQTQSPQLAYRIPSASQAPSRQTQHSEASRQSRIRESYKEQVLGTPPVGRIASPQLGTLSCLSPTLGRTPSVTGSSWTLNRQQHRAQKPSIASSYCDTISTCLTGTSEAFGMYDGDNAQDQRAKLLQTVQQNKTARRKDGQQQRNSGSEHKSFFNHTARNSLLSQTQRPPSPSTTSSGPTPTRKPTHLTIRVGKEADLAGESVSPLTAPLTPPLTPAERTHKAMALTPSSSSPLLASAPLKDVKPTFEQDRADRLARLRPLSLAVSQQQTSHSVRFMAMASPSPVNKSHSYNQSTSSYNSSSNATTAGPSSASSSNTSLFQAHISPSRLSYCNTPSPSRATFQSKRLSRNGAAPLGVLPTLSADASPSFLTSNTTPRSLGGPFPVSSPHSQSWDTTSSPRFNRASANVGAIPYHSPLSVDAFSPPNMVRRR